MTCCSLYKAVSICSLRWKKIQKLNAGVSWNLQRITASLVCAFFFDLQLTYFRTSDMFCLLSLGYHRSLCVVWFLSSFLFLLFKYYIFTDTKKDIRGQKIFLCIYLPRDCLLGYLLLPYFFLNFLNHTVVLMLRTLKSHGKTILNKESKQLRLLITAVNWKISTHRVHSPNWDTFWSLCLMMKCSRFLHLFGK